MVFVFDQSQQLHFQAVSPSRQTGSLRRKGILPPRYNIHKVSLNLNKMILCLLLYDAIPRLVRCSMLLAWVSPLSSPSSSSPKKATNHQRRWRRASRTAPIVQTPHWPWMTSVRLAAQQSLFFISPISNSLLALSPHFSFSLTAST